MKLHPSLRNAFLALALALSVCAQCAAGTLPQLEADSLGGTHVVLPRDAAGKPLVLLLAFTKQSEPQLKSWSRQLLQNKVIANAAVYVVVVADKIVFFAKKGVRKTVEEATVGTKEQRDNNVLITFNGAGWRDLVPPGDKETVGVVVCDPSGSIVFAKREAYSDANVAEVEKAAH
jgi:predicted transcriptional regulator